MSIPTSAKAAMPSDAEPQPIGEKRASKVSIGATHPDVSFFVVAKCVLHQQDAEGGMGVPSYFLFSEVSLNEGSRAAAARVLFPGGSLEDFSRRGSSLRIKQRDFASREQLDKAFPDGTYRFEIDAPGGHITPFAVRLQPRRADSPFPAPIGIGCKQAGKTAPLAAIDPKLDLVVTWTPFSTGQSDPGGILGDVVFVILRDGTGTAVARSAPPFKATPALSYAEQEFRIPAERLEPASVYKLHVEHVEFVDIQNRDGVVGLAAFPSVTQTMLSTRSD